MISFSESKGSRRKPRKSKRSLTLHLAVRDVTPRIWRQLRVPDTIWLSRLHDTIQILFSWYDYQLHRFNVHGVFYGNPGKGEGDVIVEDDRDFMLADLELSPKDAFEYQYSFGDGWAVDIRVERIESTEDALKHPECLDGKLNGPPEACGGPEGYKEILYSFKHPDEPVSKEWLDWLGDAFDPAEFDLEKTNKALSKLPK
jgi:hypothetical protein